MKGLESKTFEAPDEKRMFEGNGYADVVMVADRPVSRGTFEPGWKWSNNIKPIAGTPSCMTSHLGYVQSGRMRIMMDDGPTMELGPGDVFAIEPGHDAEVLGNEDCVVLDFGEIANYAKRA
ncbi:cupin domain-containing protein [Asanoa iriomotensis]|uniref:Cupin n=1 Tax=Asanoa iriomotensis TaxID=234613 RepID=A0ABQ4BYN5_9ACTN|nr:cupin domain-containing protein [Asanoa iriomotensis]GIF55641.1 cupin [Asanoa iriomotensis]